MLTMVLKSKSIRKIFNFKYFSFKLVDPSSMIFNHKKEMDRVQKNVTRMGLPVNCNELILNEENDFYPGISVIAGEESKLQIINKNIEATIKTPEDGWVQLYVPLDKSKLLRDHFQLWNSNSIRYGKLLQMLDYISALSCFRYNNINPRDKLATIVTASVDSIQLFADININNPLVITGYPTWVGSSSMEVRLDLYNNLKLQDDSYIGSASFMYVVREGNDYNKKKNVYKLNLQEIEDEKERHKALLRYEIGAHNKEERIQKANLSLFKIPPNQEENKILHDIFINYLQKDEKFNNAIPIKDTKITKYQLMQSQNMNINGHIFGGYIMDQALELAYVCAYMHNNNSHLEIVSVDSVNFYKPVNIGSVAHFKAEVCLVHEHLLHISVSVFNIMDELTILTTSIDVTFKAKDILKPVIPTTYECGIKYLEARRRVERLFNYI